MKWREPWLRGMLGEGMDQDGAADGMADKRRTIFKIVDLAQKYGFPGRIPWISFIRHARIADAEISSQVALQTLDELLVPRVVSGLAATLHEENLFGHGPRAFNTRVRK